MMALGRLPWGQGGFRVALTQVRAIQLLLAATLRGFPGPFPEEPASQAQCSCWRARGDARTRCTGDTRTVPALSCSLCSPEPTPACISRDERREKGFAAAALFHRDANGKCPLFPGEAAGCLSGVAAC